MVVVAAMVVVVAAMVALAVALGVAASALRSATSRSMTIPTRGKSCVAAFGTCFQMALPRRWMPMGKSMAWYCDGFCFQGELAVMKCSSCI
jgi:hypothetical protein